MSKEIREMIDKVKNFKQFANESEKKNFSFKKNVTDFGRRLSKDYIVTINYRLPYISLTNNPSKEELIKPNQHFVPKNKKELYCET